VRSYPVTGTPLATGDAILIDHGKITGVGGVNDNAIQADGRSDDGIDHQNYSMLVRDYR